MNIPAVPIEVLDTAASTMDEARRRVIEGRVSFDAEGTPSSWGVGAEEQTAGRGQRGRAWHTVRGESLSATYYVRRRFDLPEQAGRISIMAGVAVAGLLQSLGSVANVALKWPNDILAAGKKAGGILIETVRAPDGGWVALVGVGINIFTMEFPEELRKSATSLALESSDVASLPPPQELASAIGAVLNAYAGTHSALSFAAWISQWRALDATAGRHYETEWNGAVATGKAEGIDDAGALLLRLDNGSLAAVTSATSLREVPR